MTRAGARMRWVRPPRQARSRDKLARMLDAAGTLLEETTFEKLTMAQIAKRAGVSVGLLYTRFRGKDSVLAALYDQHLRELRETIDTVLDPARWKNVPIPQFVEELVSFTVRFHRAHRGLLRSLVVYGRARRTSQYDDPAERARTAIAGVGRLLASRAPDVPHPEPRLAGSLGYLFVVGAVREKILFAEGPARALAISDRQLAAELTRAFLAYLGWPGTTHHGVAHWRKRDGNAS